MDQPVRNRRRLKNYAFNFKSEVKYYVPHLITILASLGAFSFYHFRVLKDLQMIAAGTHQPDLGLYVGAVIEELSLTYALLMIALAIFGFIIAINHVHRIIGPMVPIFRHLEKLKAGQFNDTLEIRDKDLMHDLVERINSVSAALKSKFGPPSERGFSLIEVLIGAAIVSATMLAIMSLGDMSRKIQAQSTTTSSLDLLRKNFSATLLSQTGWTQTINHSLNSNMGCLRDLSSSCTGGTENPLSVIVDGAGQVLFDQTKPKNGYSPAGLPCDGFDVVNGNPQCPIRYRVTWQAKCPAGACTNPPILVKGTLVYNSGLETDGRLSINPQNYSFEVVRAASGAVRSFVIDNSQLNHYHVDCNPCVFPSGTELLHCVAACNRYCGSGCEVAGGPGRCASVLPGLGFSGGTITECSGLMNKSVCSCTF